MKDIFFKVLLVGGLFLFLVTTSFAEKVYSDVFIYKISDTVYSLNDLKENHKNLVSLNCYYPDSLLVKIFSNMIALGKNKSIFEIKDYTKSNYSKVQKQYFKSAITYHKLKFYGQAHKTPLKKEIARAFFMASRKLKCSKKIFDENKNFLSSFEEVMRIEVFLRSRYLPEQRDGKKIKSDVDQAIDGIENLLGSIDKQISEEVFW